MPTASFTNPLTNILVMDHQLKEPVIEFCSSGAIRQGLVGRYNRETFMLLSEWNIDSSNVLMKIKGNTLIANDHGSMSQLVPIFAHTAQREGMDFQTMSNDKALDPRGQTVAHYQWEHIKVDDDDLFSQASAITIPAEVVQPEREYVQPDFAIEYVREISEAYRSSGLNTIVADGLIGPRQSVQWSITPATTETLFFPMERDEGPEEAPF